MKITPVQSTPQHPLSPIVDWYLSANPGDAIDVTELPVEYAALTSAAFSIEIANATINTETESWDCLQVDIESLGRGRTSSGFRITRR